jgi:hypothetical protein
MENIIKPASGDLLLFHKYNETGYQKTSLELSQDGDIQLIETRECTSFVSLDDGNPVQITRYLISMLDLIGFIKMTGIKSIENVIKPIKESEVGRY